VQKLKTIKIMSTIPPFDHNHVLPPHKGSPAIQGDISPYKSTIMTFCQRFATSAERIVILKNFVSFRLRMIDFGVTDGFQWIDGSFSENIEISEERAPNDIDVVTFFKGISIATQMSFISNFIEFFDPAASKSTYKIDHYPVDFEFNSMEMDNGLRIIEATKYWIQLFCHNRKGVWKGMIQLPLPNDKNEEQRALEYLNSL